MLTLLHRSLSIYVHSYLPVSCDDDDDHDDKLLQSYKAAGLRYMVNRSTKTVINVSVASLVVAS